MSHLLNISSTHLRSQNQINELNSKAKFIFDFMRHEFAMAGFNKSLFNLPLEPFLWELTGDDSSGKGRFDWITVRRTKSSIMDFNCLGDPMLENQIYLSRYRVDPEATTGNQLICEILNYDNHQVINRGILLDHVETFQILYHIKLKNNNPNSNSTNFLWVRADEIKPTEHIINAMQVGILLSHQQEHNMLVKTQSKVTELSVLDYIFTIPKISQKKYSLTYKKIESFFALKNISKYYTIQKNVDNPS